MPRFSLVTPVEGTGSPQLAATLRAVRAQRAPDWEHVVVLGPDAGAEARAVVDDAARRDARVLVHRAATSLGAAAAANAALAAAGGEWIGLLAAGDELHRDALARVGDDLAPDVDLVYSDEDHVDADGNRSLPCFKPDWSPDRLRAQDYTGGLTLVRRAVVDQLGGWRDDFEPAHEHDLLLRVAERRGRAVHVADVLYHRRLGRRPAPGTSDAAVRAVAEHLARTGFAATAAPHPDRPGIVQLRPALERTPKVSIIIPTGGQPRRVRGEEVVLAAHCIESIVARSTYPDYEIVCVVDDHTPAPAREAIAAAGGDRLRIVPFADKFDFSRKINLGALAADGELLVMLNDDTEVITRDWLEHLAMYALDDAVGAVGTRLLFGDGRIQHAGIVGTWGSAGHCFYGYPADHEGYFDNIFVPLDLLAVTAACLMTRRDRFEEVGGLSLDFPLNYNDVDFCLKLHRAGYRIVCGPDAQLWHLEAASRWTGKVSDEEIVRLRDRWGYVLNHDPYYSRFFPPWSSDFVPPVYLYDGTPVPPAEPAGLYWLREAVKLR